MKSPFTIFANVLTSIEAKEPWIQLLNGKINIHAFINEITAICHAYRMNPYDHSFIQTLEQKIVDYGDLSIDLENEKHPLLWFYSISTLEVLSEGIGDFEYEAAQEDLECQYLEVLYQVGEIVNS